MVMSQTIRLSTTSSILEAQNPRIITATNQKIYSDVVFSRQPDDTLNMLGEKARKLGAAAVTGVRLVPMVDDRGIRVMMAYGTVIMEAKP